MKVQFLSIVFGVLSGVASLAQGQEVTTQTIPTPSPIPVDSTVKTVPAIREVKVQAELRQTGVMKEIFLRLQDDDHYAVGSITYRFPKPAAVPKYPDDIVELGLLVPGTKEIVQFSTGLLFRGTYRNPAGMITVIIDKLNQVVRRDRGHFTLVGEPINCLAKHVTCSELVTPSSLTAAKGGQ